MYPLDVVKVTTTLGGPAVFGAAPATVVELAAAVARGFPRWRALGSPEAATAGGQWLASNGAALLKVPSALVPPEANYLVNPQHRDASRLIVGSPEPLEWDARLFGIPSPI